MVADLQPVAAFAWKRLASVLATISFEGCRLATKWSWILTMKKLIQSLFVVAVILTLNA